MAAFSSVDKRTVYELIRLLALDKANPSKQECKTLNTCCSKICAYNVCSTEAACSYKVQISAKRNVFIYYF